MLAMICYDPFSAAGTYESCFLNIGQALKYSRNIYVKLEDVYKNLWQKV